MNIQLRIMAALGFFGGATTLAAGERWVLADQSKAQVARDYVLNVFRNFFAAGGRIAFEETIPNHTFTRRGMHVVQRGYTDLIRREVRIFGEGMNLGTMTREAYRIEQANRHNLWGTRPLTPAQVEALKLEADAFMRRMGFRFTKH